MNRLFPLALVGLCLTAPASAQITSFQHVIVVVQENRTPDNLFQGLCTQTPSACSTQASSQQYDIQTVTTGWADNTSSTGTTNPHVNPLGLGYDLSHAHIAFVAMCDLKKGVCTMDGAAGDHCIPYAQQCPSKPSFGYVDPSAAGRQEERAANPAKLRVSPSAEIARRRPRLFHFRAFPAGSVPPVPSCRGLFPGQPHRDNQDCSFEDQQYIVV
jgi:hypothetical protein